MPRSDQNPFDYHDVRLFITNALKAEGYVYGKDYEINDVPNIIDIAFGRNVGYTITEHDLGEEINKISATNIRKQFNESSNYQ